jgi:hypothetical protein
MSELTLEEKRKYVFLTGKGGIEALATIDALRPFIEMAQSDVGKEFLEEDIKDHAFLINKCFDSLIKDGATDQRDVIKLQLTYGRLKKHYDRLTKYEGLVAKVKAAKEADAKVSGTGARPKKRTRRPFGKAQGS